ncbi:hypothetical protein CVU37_05835 [candidate division BRC1 bacterium HGW-BRC1-1]|nr:MAG: hypothetical protein CVU37_05835 [candidate division BRC1 bacterium HGW-BRC1-1]
MGWDEGMKMKRSARRGGVLMILAMAGMVWGCAVGAAAVVTTGPLECGGRMFVDLPDETTTSAARHGDGTRGRVVVYALPNGNTIEQTRGRKVMPGMDWHFGIQHIGAQTRALRKLQPDVPTAVVYLEAEGRSWPTWRRNELVAHSGGGSLLIGFINAVEDIPSTVTRIAFLDANYAYDSATSQSAKLARWLRSGERNALVVAAYDDRRVEVNGKRIVSEQGGTWGRTQAMVRDLRREAIALEETSGTLIWSARGFDGRVDINAHRNPENKILHTVIVERNGFLHALLGGTKQDPGFFTDSIYEPLIDTIEHE